MTLSTNSNSPAGGDAIRAFSVRLVPPYSGQVQIAESDTYRAVTVDGAVWEIQYVNRTHVRVATMTLAEIKAYAEKPEVLEDGSVDTDLVQLLTYLTGITLPFPAADKYEYWLLDAADDSPLAMIFSCAEAAQMEKFPERPEWTALPAAVMPVTKTEEEEENQTPPVNYQLERLVAERAGSRMKGRWVDRSEPQTDFFPPFMVREDWLEESEQALCQRYLERQAPRLLMLHGLSKEDRGRLESWCRPQAVEVARFVGVYPEIVDDDFIQALCVEARFRSAHDQKGKPTVHTRRDGVLYI